MCANNEIWGLCTFRATKKPLSGIGKVYPRKPDFGFLVLPVSKDKLYENFADPFSLWECKLTTRKCSHHNDSHLTEKACHMYCEEVKGKRETEKKLEIIGLNEKLVLF
ncbi:hypothetical protein GQX74_014484 [Glossina fuscipes]|nr:hypothetical protein GQX74_014484 [Glossina fuscipes]